MSAEQRHVSEEESRRVAEESRQEEWTHPSFMKELFLGDFRFDLLYPYPIRREWRPEFKEFHERLKEFLVSSVDPTDIDEQGEYPQHVLDGLARLGAFGMKIPTEYGGLGFDQVEYARVMELVGSYDGNLVALLSAHQSIGVPQPIKLFGSEEQKKKYLPRCARGEISAFALTEPDVGSDPARLTTSVTTSADGTHYVLNGIKLWCTNGTIARMFVVMAKHAENGKISAFVVERDSPGVEVLHRSRFMGLRAIENGVISFRDVVVPKENLIGKEGRGLKIALTTLNDGRLSIPNACVGTAKRALSIVRAWAATREQWGRPIGRHEAMSEKLADMAATTFAMESIVKLTSAMANGKNVDLRLESAACKEWNTDRGWRILDDAMQIRGGRGYETERSLAQRGEAPLSLDRMMRDFRINRIFEGSSEIMHLLMAREAVDKHLQVAGAFVDPKAGLGTKLGALPRIASFYAWWYPSRWLGWSWWPKYSQFGAFAPHLRFIERAARRLARSSFHGMLVYQAGLERKQLFLFRLVDVVNELFAMSASISRAHTMKVQGDPRAIEAEELALAFCAASRRRIEQSFHGLWHNDDARKVEVAKRMLEGAHDWMEGTVDGLAYRGPAPESALAQEPAAK